MRLHLMTLGVGLLVCAGTLGACSRRESAPRDAAAAPLPATSPSTTQEIAVKNVSRTDAEWKAMLTAEQYRVLREKGTERAYTGKYEKTKTKGVYSCAGCGAHLFTSDAKFDSGCGWPSFFTPLAKGAVVETVDTSHGMTRTEITCAACGGHLGHVFEDAPNQPTGLRYCINSVSLQLIPADDASEMPKK
jgi:peptide-methionine (R)-S-oxide reductase